MTQGWFRLQIGSFRLENRWAVEPGSVLVLFGPSGAGKTMSLRAIAGLVRPQEGHVEIGGRVVYDGATRVSVPPHQRRAGYLTQQYHLFPHLTVAANIAYGLAGNTPASGPAVAQRGASSQVRDLRAGRVAPDQVAALVQAFHLQGLEKRRTWELSGGQQQRVALARALAPGPEVLLLDEPFAALDAELRRVLRGELRALLAEARIPVILVTHDREEALALGDAVQVIDQGRVLAGGQPLAVLGQPGRGRVARLVGVENLLRLQVEGRHPQDGTMICAGHGLRLEVPLDQPHVQLDLGGAGGVLAGSGQPSTTDEDGGRTSAAITEAPEMVTVGIRASDIILAQEEIRGSSARNRLPGVVAGVVPKPPGYEVTLDCGVPLRCHITGAALTEMGIAPGMALWAVFKASSCFLVQEEVGGME